MPSSRGSSRPGIESRSPALQADSLLSEPPHILFMVLGERGPSRGSEKSFHYQVLNFGSWGSLLGTQHGPNHLLRSQGQQLDQGGWSSVRPVAQFYWIMNMCKTLTGGDWRFYFRRGRSEQSDFWQSHSGRRGPGNLCEMHMKVRRPLPTSPSALPSLLHCGPGLRLFPLGCLPWTPGWK